MNYEIAKIRKVPESESGIPDGVEADASCVISEFEVDDVGNLKRLDSFPKSHKCTILASHTNSTVSVCVDDAGFMMTVRMEVLKALLGRADEAAEETTAN